MNDAQVAEELAYLPLPPCTSLDLPVPPYISLYLPQVAEELAGLAAFSEETKQPALDKLLGMQARGDIGRYRGDIGEI